MLTYLVKIVTNDFISLLCADKDREMSISMQT
jgi:hypothetical protein